VPHSHGVQAHNLESFELHGDSGNGLRIRISHKFAYAVIIGVCMSSAASALTNLASTGENSIRRKHTQYLRASSRPSQNAGQTTRYLVFAWKSPPVLTEHQKLQAHVHLPAIRTEDHARGISAGSTRQEPPSAPSREPTQTSRESCHPFRLTFETHQQPHVPRIPSRARNSMSNEWLRWEKVDTLNFPGHGLFRSSCPNYYKAKGDKSQNLTPTAVKLLVKEGINGIISFNEYEYDATEKKRLKDANIRYIWLPVIDYNAQTMDQLEKALKFHRDTPNAVTLVHCGFGWGRTGVGITALQLVVGKGDKPARSTWKIKNHLEKNVQFDALDEWIKLVKRGKV